MNITPAHLDALVAFGYTEQEARFLYIAATHSGYFTVQQFLSFIGARYGKRNGRFVQKLLALGHASAQRHRRKVLLYHIDSRRIYAAIGKDCLPGIRKHELLYIKTRLLGLDFILSHPEENYFETAKAKLHYFIETCKLDPNLFCARNKKQPYITFGDGFPLCIANPAPNSDPVVTFTYVNSGYPSLGPYLAYLRRYRPLLRQLPSLQFFYIATKFGRHEEAGQIFSLLVEGDGLADLLRFFDVQTKWDDKQYTSLSDQDLIFRNGMKKRFGWQTLETMRRIWRRNQLSKYFEPQKGMSEHKQKIVFRAMVAPGHEGVFGGSTKNRARPERVTVKPDPVKPMST